MRPLAVTPTNKANENPFNASPPKRNNTNTTNNVVTEVINVLLKVEFNDLFNVTPKVVLFVC